MLSPLDSFPAHPPCVSFTGLVIGPGFTLLDEEHTSHLGDEQRKLCGFVQLSTHISPEMPNKPPFKGYHHFQVFVIWPIHAKPWLLYYKNILNGADSPFQPNIFFSCSGKVAGFLDHGIMLDPPDFKEDRVFIVVPDSWKFHENANRPTRPVTSPLVTKQPGVDPHNRSMFMTPSKQTSSIASNCLC